MTILYIEDDLEDQEIFAEALKSIDNRIPILYSKGGAEALQMLEASFVSPDLIFLDLNLAGELDGKQFLKKMKKDKRFESIPVVVFTTSRRTEDKMEMLKSGARDYVVKPDTYTGVCEILQSTITPFLSDSHHRV